MSSVTTAATEIPATVPRLASSSVDNSRPAEMQKSASWTSKRWSSCLVASLSDIHEKYQGLLGSMSSLVGTVREILDFNLFMTHLENLLDESLPPINESEGIRRLPKNISRLDRCNRLASILWFRVKIHGGLYITVVGASSKLFIEDVKKSGPLRTAAISATKGVNYISDMSLRFFPLVGTKVRDVSTLMMTKAVGLKTATIATGELWITKGVEFVSNIKNSVVPSITIAAGRSPVGESVISVRRAFTFLEQIVPHQIVSAAERMLDVVIASCLQPGVLSGLKQRYAAASQQDALSTSSTESGCTTSEVTPSNVDENKEK